jgi:broad specificity phosphatase PhoE
MIDPTAFEQVTRERLTVLEERFDQAQARLNGNLEKMWTAIDKLRERPPAWVAVLLSTGGAVIGAMGMWILNHLNR